MNTTENDIEEVREIITTDLSGDKIERLLYKAGFDTQTKIGADDIHGLEITGDGVIIFLSEIWAEAGSWYIDPKTAVLDTFVGDAIVVTTYAENVTTEEELVEAIEAAAEQA